MKKKFKLQDLDCANCAAKMEEGIKKINGVKDASVSFMTQKMTIEAEEEDFERIMQEVVKVCAKVEPDCKVLLQNKVPGYCSELNNNSPIHEQEDRIFYIDLPGC